MIHFDLLGRIELRREEGAAVTSVLAQPKRTALLARLVLASPGGRVRREELLALYWPELDERRARDALNSAVHYLRRSLGAESIVSVGHHEVGVDHARFQCDAVRFEELAREGSAEAALELYRGDLCPGLPEQGASVELERWFDAERERLRRLAVRTALSAAAAAVAESRMADAAALARRAVGLDPVSEATALRAIEVLAPVAGAAVLREIRDGFVARLREELELEPAEDFERAAAALIAAAAKASNGGGKAEASSPPAAASETPRHPPHGEVPAATSSAGPAGAAPPLPARSRAIPASPDLRRRWLLSAAAIAALLAAGGTLVFGGGGLRSGAGPGSGGADAPIAAMRSAEARRSFVEGEGHFRAGLYAEAIRDFRSAIRSDRGFALAYYRLSTAANWTNQPEVAGAALDSALARAGTLSRVDRIRLEAWASYLRGHPVRAERQYRELLELNPDDAESWFYLGETLFHWGPTLGLPIEESRAAFERAAAPATASALLHLARLAAGRGDIATFDSLAAAAAAGEDAANQRLELEGLRAFAFGDERARRRIESGLSLAPLWVRRQVITSVAAHGADPVVLAGLVQRLTPGEGMATERLWYRLMRAQLLFAAGRAAEASESLDPDEALPPARALEYRAAMAAVPAGTPERPAIRRMLAELERGPWTPDKGPLMLSATINGIYEPTRLFLAGLLRLRLGEPLRAEEHADALVALRSDTHMDSVFAADFAGTLRAGAALERGRPDVALSALGTPRPEADGNLPGILSYAEAFDRWFRLEALRATGHVEEARRWLATFPDPAAYDILFAPAVAAAEDWRVRAAGE